MTITEKAAYLRGLVEGQELDPEAGEGKLWHVLSELVGDMAAELKSLREDQDDLSDSLDEVEVGMDYLEELLQEDYDDYGDFEDEEDDGEIYPFSSSGGFRIVDDEDDEDDYVDDEDDPEGVYYEVECPNCREVISFSDETLEEGSIQCPNCGAMLEFDISGQIEPSVSLDDAEPEDGETD